MAATFLIELNPSQLVYLTKLLDRPGDFVGIPNEHVLDHAGIRQQLANPGDTRDIVEKFKQAGREEAAQAPQSAPPSNLLPPYDRPQ